MSRKLLAAAVCALALLAPAVAIAEPSAADKTLAHSLFEEGRTLGKAGKWSEACLKFEASQKLAGGIGTLFNLGDCYEHVGRIASAWTAFTDAAEQSKAAGQNDRELIASSRALLLLPKVAKVRLDLKEKPAGFEARIDGRPIPAASVGGEIPIDPGEHTLSFSAKGKRTREVPVRIEVAGSVLLVDVPPLEDEIAVRPVPPPPPPVAQQPVTEPPPVEHAEERPWHTPVAITATALAVVGLGFGTVFGLRASSQWEGAKATCPANDCDDKGYDGWKDARSSGTISNISFIAGGVLAATAVVLWITTPSRRAAVAPPRTFFAGGAF